MVPLTGSTATSIIIPLPEPTFSPGSNIRRRKHLLSDPHQVEAEISPQSARPSGVDSHDDRIALATAAT